MIYYLKNIGFGLASGVLVVLALFCADCFDGSFTAAISLSIKCLVLAVLAVPAIPWIAEVKRRSMPRRIEPMPELQNRQAVLVPMHQRRRDGI